MQKTANHESLENLIVAAREAPRILGDLMLASSGSRVLRHDIQQLMISVVMACYKARRHCLIQGPPEHAKTTILLPLFIHILSRDPSLRFGLMSADNDHSKDNINRLRNMLLDPVCRAVFPHLQPDHRMSQASGKKGEWSNVKLVLKGQSLPAFQRLPVQGKIEGHRIDIGWADDVVTRAVLTSQAERDLTYQVLFGSLMNRLTNRGIIIATNNCWHREDAIHRMKESEAFCTLWLYYTEELDGIHYKIINPPLELIPEGHDPEEPITGRLPIWDTLWPVDRLEAKRKEDLQFWKRLFRGLAISPDDCSFPYHDQWGTYNFAEIPKDGSIVAFLDPAGGEDSRKGCYAAMPVLHRSADGRVFRVLDVWCDRKPVSVQIRKCFDMHQKMRRMGFKNGIDNFEVEMMPKEKNWIREPFMTMQARLKSEGFDSWDVPFRIRAPKGEKKVRMERLGTPLEFKTLLWPDNLEHMIETNQHWRRAVSQMDEFPHGDFVDFPDALIGAIDTDPRTSEAMTGNPLEGFGVF